MELYIPMKKLLLALGFCLWASVAWAQCTGVFPPNTLCGNLGVTPAPPAAFTATTSLFGPTVTTSGQVPTFGSPTGNQLVDQSTITTSQVFNFTGQTSQFSSQITSAAISIAQITSTQITSTAIQYLNVTSSFIYKGVPYTFPTPLLSAVTSVTVGYGLGLTGITSPNIVFVAPAATSTLSGGITSTTSTLFVMGGFGVNCKLTTNYSSRAIVTFSGFLQNSLANDAAGTQGRFAAGATAPTVGTIASGTVFSGIQQYTASGNNAVAPFGYTVIVSGLVPGQPYWFDSSLEAVTGGTASMQQVGCTVVEF